MQSITHHHLSNRKRGLGRLPGVAGAAGFALAAVLGLTGCGGGDSADMPVAVSESGTPVVHVVNYPLMYFAERIGGDAVDVRFAAPGDGDPAFWEPTDADIAAMQSANVILLNGADYAKWRAGASLPMSRAVDTSAGFAGAYIEVKSTGSHSHGAGDEHGHDGTAFTTWMDFDQAVQQATAVRDALLAAAPSAEASINANAAALAAELATMDADFRTVAAGLAGQPLTASHPVYQYFARAYDLDIEAVLWEPEVVPDDAAMAEFTAMLADHPAKWMIWEGDPDPASVAKLDAMGLRSVVIDPCGNRPDGGDWMSVMKANLEALRSMAG
ncbi:MAG: metal ABC transporter substrate-binding protein [Phycisphaerales bacterium]